MEEKILSYGDVLLRRRDVELLNGCYFLNDNIIEFFFSYLQRNDKPSDDCPVFSPRRSVLPLLLVGPSTTFWIMNCPDVQALQPVISPLVLPHRKIVMFAINNNEDVSIAEGGSHWSLLVYDRKRNIFEHYDSLGGANSAHAFELYKIVKMWMGVAAYSARFAEPGTPQQKNGYDCGVYVMAIAETLHTVYMDEEQHENQDMVELIMRKITPEYVSEMRRRTKEVIEDLSRKNLKCV